MYICICMYVNVIYIYIYIYTYIDDLSGQRAGVAWQIRIFFWSANGQGLGLTERCLARCQTVELCGCILGMCCSGLQRVAVAFSGSQ